MRLSRPGSERQYLHVEGAKVQLWETDAFDPDDHLSYGHDAMTDNNGSFTVAGVEEEIFFKTEPYLLVEHNCPYTNSPLKKPTCVYETCVNLIPQTEKQFLMIELGDQEKANIVMIKSAEGNKGLGRLKIFTVQKCF